MKNCLFQLIQKGRTNKLKKNFLHLKWFKILKKFIFASKNLLFKQSLFKEGFKNIFSSNPR